MVQRFFGRVDSENVGDLRRIYKLITEFLINLTDYTCSGLDSGIFMRLSDRPQTWPFTGAWYCFIQMCARGQKTC